MDHIAPEGPVYQAGTLSGNPLAMGAGIATLKMLRRPHTYQVLEEKANKLAQGLTQAAEKTGAKVHFNRVGSMMCGFFTSKKVIDYQTALTSDTDKYSKFFWAMLERGVYFAPSQFEAAFVSIAHTDEDIVKTVEAAEEAYQIAERNT